LVNDRSWSIKSSNNIGEVGDNYLENEPNPIKCPFIILDSLKACCLGKPEDKYEREQNAGEREQSFQRNHDESENEPELRSQDPQNVNDCDYARNYHREHVEVSL